MSIYEIKCNKSGARYIGSTIRSLEARMVDHEQKYARWAQNPRGPLPSQACTILALGDYSMRELEKVEGCDAKQLLRRERYYCLNTECVNTYLPGTRRRLVEAKANAVKQRAPMFIGCGFTDVKSA